MTRDGPTPTTTHSALIAAALHMGRGKRKEGGAADATPAPVKDQMPSDQDWLGNLVLGMEGDEADIDVVLAIEGEQGGVLDGLDTDDTEDEGASFVPHDSASVTRVTHSPKPDRGPSLFDGVMGEGSPLASAPDGQGGDDLMDMLDDAGADFF
ncbi:hypothetical protein KIPB_005673 [Kipferlia bialata]|uniref:Uncharacterized protein n=1 Tax=Kipferlia bialata TaxID=797122 RepID=A0A9K3GJ86_9EUKA|nr:hypothetical protein KIPB_005673 [Kipferlia bialata]|eukprot:g5673.t1